MTFKVNCFKLTFKRRLLVQMRMDSNMRHFFECRNVYRTLPFCHLSWRNEDTFIKTRLVLAFKLSLMNGRRYKKNYSFWGTQQWSRSASRRNGTKMETMKTKITVSVKQTRWTYLYRSVQDFSPRNTCFREHGLRNEAGAFCPWKKHHNPVQKYSHAATRPVKIATSFLMPVFQAARVKITVSRTFSFTQSKKDFVVMVMNKTVL